MNLDFHPSFFIAYIPFTYEVTYSSDDDDDSTVFDDIGIDVSAVAVVVSAAISIAVVGEDNESV